MISIAMATGTLVVASTLTACRNGANNGADTVGINGNSAAGQVMPDAGPAMGAPADTSSIHADTTHRADTTRRP